MRLLHAKLLLVVAVALLVALVSLSACAPLPPVTPGPAVGPAPLISLSQAIALSQSHSISKAVLRADQGTMTITAAVPGDPINIKDVDGQPITVTNGTDLTADTGGLNLANLQQLGFVLPPDYTTLSGTSSGIGSWLGSFLPFLLLILMLFFIFRAGRGVQNQTGGFGRSRAKLINRSLSSVTFTDVAGVDEAKQELQEVVDFLKSPAKFRSLGARIPKGVLLVGPPGTGKTLLARAVAGEAGVPFFSISGSEFVEMFVGVGASRVRDLFMQAKQNQPCIIFMDEIDAVGRRRGGEVHSNEEREQTLNQILAEMDGFTPNAGIIVLAATNRPDVLDPALLRPGRFDRRVIVDLPDLNGRLAILKVHAAGKPLDEKINLEVLAKQTQGFSGADLANLMNEAAILTARRGLKTVGLAELEESIDRVIAGPQRKSRRISAKERDTVAYHESGHALVARLQQPDADPVHKISIVARGAMGGYTRLLPLEERYLFTKSQLKANLVTFLGGHVAEVMVFGEVSTGPHSDIKQATSLARKMVTNYGMGEGLPLRTFGNGTDTDGIREFAIKDYDAETGKKIDDEVNRLLINAQRLARELLTNNRERLIHLAERLKAVETLEGAELEAAFTEPIKGPGPMPVPTPVAATQSQSTRF